MRSFVRDPSGQRPWRHFAEAAPPGKYDIAAPTGQAAGGKAHDDPCEERIWVIGGGGTSLDLIGPSRTLLHEYNKLDHAGVNALFRSSSSSSSTSEYFTPELWLKDVYPARGDWVYGKPSGSTGDKP